MLSHLPTFHPNWFPWVQLFFIQLVLVPWAVSSFCSLLCCWSYSPEDKPRHGSSLASTCVKDVVPHTVKSQPVSPACSLCFSLLLPCAPAHLDLPLLCPLVKPWPSEFFFSLSLCLGDTPTHSSRDNLSAIYVKSPPAPATGSSHSRPLHNILSSSSITALVSVLWS